LTRITTLFQLTVAVSCFAMASAAAQSLAAQDAQKPLTVEAIFAHGHLIGDPPEDPTWSPDGKHLTYLDGGELIDLEPGLAGGEGKPHVIVSRAKLAALEGKDGSETDRDHRERYKMAELPVGA
jgi:hypothetical protein